MTSMHSLRLVGALHWLLCTLNDSHALSSTLGTLIDSHMFSLTLVYLSKFLRASIDSHAPPSTPISLINSHAFALSLTHSCRSSGAFVNSQALSLTLIYAQLLCTPMTLVDSHDPHWLPWLSLTPLYSLHLPCTHLDPHALWITFMYSHWLFCTLINSHPCTLTDSHSKRLPNTSIKYPAQLHQLPWTLTDSFAPVSSQSCVSISFPEPRCPVHAPSLIFSKPPCHLLFMRPNPH